MISFASDNCAAVHPAVMEALNAANTGHAPSYGGDRWTKELSERLNALFGREVYAYPMMNGTGANVAALAHITLGYSSAVCADVCHMHTNETGAPERIAGVKLLAEPHAGGKLTVENIEKHMPDIGNEHHAQPRAVILTQATELGTVYTPGEVKAIAGVCRRNGLLLYMDGARIANAAAYLGVDIAGFTCDAGVDILCLGGTKNGAMYGECLVFFDRALGERFIFTRKNTAQLASKMRYISAQFSALLTNGLWLENARRANETAAYIAKGLQEIRGIEIAYPVESNQIFFKTDEKTARGLQKDFEFFSLGGLRRLVTSWDSRLDDADKFISAVKSNINA